MFSYGRSLLVVVFLLLTGCVTKQEYLKLQDQYKQAVAELEEIKPQLEETAAQLEEAKARLEDLDEAQKQMEENLRSEIEEKSIRLEKLNDRLTVTFLDKILFDSGKSVIKERGKKALRKVADSLNQIKNHNFHVEGHTDNQKIGIKNRKKYPTNWELSAARATAVVRFLETEGKVNPAHLFPVGGSYFHPVASNDTLEGRSDNRRVEIVLTPILNKNANEEKEQ